MLIFKKTKKTLALVMALAFCLCALPTLTTAEEPAYALNGTINSLMIIIDSTPSTGTDTEGEINIQLQTGGTGAIFTAYKLLDIERDNTTNMLKVSIPTTGDAQDFWNKYVTSVKDDFTGTATIDDIKKAINSFGTNDSKKSSSIVDEFVKYSSRNFTKKSSSEVVSGKAQITTDFGFYAILQTGAPVNGHIASAPVLACLPMQETDSSGNNTENWLKSYTVKPKDDTISITKQVKASGDAYKDETITNIGDTVSYEIIAELPTYGADIVNSGITYTIEDAPNPTNALTLDKDSITVSYTKEADKTTDAYSDMPADAFAVTTSGNVFTFKFTDGYYATAINGEYTYIKITYSATLNGFAVVEGDGNINTATLTYSSYAGAAPATTTADAKVYTMGLDITKIEKDSNPIKTLAGAEFEVYTDAAGTEVNRLSFIETTGSDEIKRYRVATPGETGSVTKIVVTDSTDADKNGKLMIDGLNDTTYYLKETKAPTGYNLSTDLFEINVAPTAYTDGTAADDYTDDTNAVLDFDEHRLSKDIENSTGIDLPVTGGMGTVIFTAIGLLLMAGAAYFLFRGKKSSN